MMITRSSSPHQILLYTHYTAVPGVADKFFSYFSQTRQDQTYYYQTPLFPREKLLLRLSTNNNQTLVGRKAWWPIQFFTEWYYLWSARDQLPPNFDLGIAFDVASFVNLFFLKRILHLKKIVYFNVDYSIQRFRQPWLNFIYHRLNNFALRHSNQVFLISQKFATDYQLDARHIAYAVVPHTIEYQRFQLPVRAKKTPTSLNIVYAGSISYNLDFSPLLGALSRLPKDYTFTLTFYGTGDQIPYLKQEIKELGLSKHVQWSGVVPSDKLIYELLPTYDLAVAPYKTANDQQNADHMFQTTDLSTKIVEYLGAALPVIATPINSAFQLLPQHQLGSLASNESEWLAALEKYFSQPTLLRRTSQNARRFAARFDVAQVLDPLIEPLLTAD